MSKFKKGDRVYYIDKDTGELSATFEVSHTYCDSVWFTTGTWMPEGRLMLERPDAAYKPTATGWDAHTAGNLRTAALVAVESYNNYVKQHGASPLWRELELR